MTRRGAPSTRRSQLGATLLIMLVILALGVSWFAVTRLAAHANFTAVERARNAEVLARAKTALIGHVAHVAARSGEDNPGRLPCPEAPGYFGDPAQEGIAAGSCSTANKTGRLPWRTLGLDKLVDASGEPLWYAVSPGWAYAGSSLKINSNTPGSLTVDGAPDDAIALLIAPGAAMRVSASSGCSAWTQSRPSAGPLDVRNYLECENATSPADSTFVTSGPDGSFNDQVVRVTVADLMPAIEAAIAHRVDREIVPQLKGVYASAAWGLSATNPVYAYPAPFADPATSSYQGASGTYAGLLPFTYAQQGCNPVTDPRCSTTFVSWNTTAPYAPSVTLTGVSAPLYSCPVVNATTIQCTGTYVAAALTVQLRLNATANNVAMALKQFDPSKVSVQVRQLPLLAWQSAPATMTGQFNSSDSTVTVAAVATVPGTLLLSYAFDITADISAFADHALLDASTSSSTGWFVRNEWYRLAHYAIAPGHAASAAAPRSCVNAVTCLNVANVAPAGKQRAVLILAGRALAGQARPSSNLADFLEFGNASAPAAYERQPVSTAIAPALKKPFNDRIVVVDANP